MRKKKEYGIYFIKMYEHIALSEGMKDNAINLSCDYTIKINPRMGESRYKHPLLKHLKILLNITKYY